MFAADHYAYLRNSDIEKLIKKINEKALAGWVVSEGISQAVVVTGICPIKSNTSIMYSCMIQN